MAQNGLALAIVTYNGAEQRILDREDFGPIGIDEIDEAARPFNHRQTHLDSEIKIL